MNSMDEDEPDDKREIFTSSFGIILRVGHSPISRYGLFAVRDIYSGTRIIEYVGEHVSPEEGDRRDEEQMTRTGMFYVFELNNNESIDGYSGGNQSIYINHTCEPNCRYVIEKNHIYIEAVKNIHPGEELSYDYECSSNDDPILCLCGAKSCRKTINLNKSI